MVGISMYIHIDHKQENLTIQWIGKYTIHLMGPMRAMLGKSFSLNLLGCHAQQDLGPSDAFFHADAENAETLRLKGLSCDPWKSRRVFLFVGFD